MLTILMLLLIAALVIILFVNSKKRKNTEDILPAIPDKWRSILIEKVNFYRNLNEEQKMQYESDIQRFLSDITITGVQVKIELADRLLIASSAVIPLFGFPAWNYKYLDEVILYPSSFDRNFNIGSKEEIITGMVGNGPMEGKMILSKPSLHLGFDITTDKKNVGIHEFVHLFDKETGHVDGVPPGYEEKASSLPWLQFVKEKIDEIIAKESDINDYGATNKQEFFAVASEYFFERPHLLQEKHPKLYGILSEVFNQDITSIIDKGSFVKRKSVGRNDACPCGSGDKYKQCCLV